jgi:hypothetical protein
MIMGIEQDDPSGERKLKGLDARALPDRADDVRGRGGLTGLLVRNSLQLHRLLIILPN